MVGSVDPFLDIADHGVDPVGDLVVRIIVDFSGFYRPCRHHPILRLAR